MATTPIGIDRKLFLLLLTPSWLSGFVAVTLTLCVSVGSMLLLHFGNIAHQGLFASVLYTKRSIPLSAHTVSQRILNNPTVGNMVFLLFWATVGCIVSITAAGFAKELNRIISLEKTLGYVHVDRKAFIRDAVVRLLVRIVATVCLWILLHLLVYTFMPYLIAVAHTVTTHPASITAWLDNVYAVLGCILAIHVLTIDMRLLLLRPRLTASPM